MSPHLILIIVTCLICLLMTLIISIRTYKGELKKTSKIESREQNTDQKSRPLTLDPRLSTDHQPLTQLQISKLIEMTSRFRFFQGENLQHFEKFLEAQDLKSAEHMIRQKFRAQQKHQPRKLAQEVFKKLLESA